MDGGFGRYFYTNIRDYIDSNSDEVGEADLENIISDFSCPLNPDVENFLKKNAIEFTKQRKSVTYLVGSREGNVLVGYFAITIKSINISAGSISNTLKRKCEKVSALDEATNTYRPAAYLIGQLGKNFTNGYDKLITGKELLDLALKVIGEAQYRVGGLFAFLEAKNDEKVLSFYAKNGFRRFDAAEIKTSRNKAHDLIQMFRNL